MSINATAPTADVAASENASIDPKYRVTQKVEVRFLDGFSGPSRQGMVALAVGEEYRVGQDIAADRFHAAISSDYNPGGHVTIERAGITLDELVKGMQIAKGINRGDYAPDSLAELCGRINSPSYIWHVGDEIVLDVPIEDRATGATRALAAVKAAVDARWPLVT